MKLLNWEIEGFGVFHDAGLPEPGLSAGFNLILGPNRAGKSTLLDFIRYTLFGYPKANQKKLPRREPLRGGNHGGALLYTVKGESHRLHRRGTYREEPQLFDATANSLPLEHLARNLGHVSPAVFRNVFAFSLSELEVVESLDEGDVRDLIFAASIGRAAAQVRHVQERLEKQATAIFVPKARASAQNPPQLIRLAAELEKTERELADAREVSSAVSETQRKVRDAQKLLVTLEDQIQEQEKQLRHVDRLNSGWKHWVAHCQAEAEIQRLGNVSRYPRDGWTRWTERKAAFEKANGPVGEAEEQIKSLNGQLKEFPDEFPLLSLEAQIRELVEAKTEYEVACQLAEEAVGKAVALQANWQRISKEVGPDWPADVVGEYDLALLLEDQLRSHLRAFEEARTAEATGEAKKQRLDTEVDAIARNRESTASEIRELSRDRPVLTRDGLRTERETLAGFRQAVRDRQGMKQQLDVAEKHLTHVRLYLSREAPRPLAFSSWVTQSLWIAVAAAAVGTVGFLAAKEYPAGIVCAVVAALLGFLMINLRRVESRQATSDRPAPELQQAEDGHRSARNQLEAHDTHWRERAGQRGLGWPVTELELATLQERIDTESKCSDRLEQLEADRSQLQRDEETKQRECMAMIDVVTAAELGLANQVKEWQQFLTDRRLPKTVHPETALEIFSRVREGSRVLRELNGYEEQQSQHERKRDAYLQRLRAVLMSANRRANLSPAELLAELTDVQKDMVRQQNKRDERQRLSNELNDWHTRLAQRHEAADQAQQECNRFLKNAGIASEEELRQLADWARQRQEIQQRIRTIDDTLQVIFGHAGPPQELRDAWASGQPTDWESQKHQLEEQKRQKGRERDELLGQIRSFEDAINSQLRSDVIAAKQLEAESLRAEIREGIDNWLRIAVSIELLRRTRQEFELEHQSPALDEASRLLRAVSAGNYKKVVIPLDTQELTLMPASGPPLTAAQLSRGTLEQLYLCVRLGYLRHYQKQQDAELPLLMDDATVNFDPEHMERTIQVLAECCQAGQQVLLFTCHPGLAKLVPPDACCFQIHEYNFEPLVSAETQTPL